MQKFYSLLSFFLFIVFHVSYAQLPSVTEHLDANGGCTCTKLPWKAQLKSLQPLNWEKLKRKIYAVKPSEEGYVLVKIWVDEAGFYCHHEYLQFTDEQIRDAVEAQIEKVRFKPIVVHNIPYAFCVDIPLHFEAKKQKKVKMKKSMYYAPKGSH